MNLSINNFLIIFICVLGFDFVVFLIAFLILELLMRDKEVDRYAKEKNIKDLVKKFHKKLYEVSNQHTNEILECLKEMEELDNVYYVMVDNDFKIMGEEEFIRVKSNILSDIIKNKFDDINGLKNKKDRYKALLDELNVCQKRFPLYKNVYLNYTNVIKKKI
jgi:hypothetical protein